MKKTIYTLVFLVSTSLAHAQVGIGTETPHDSSQLELQSKTKGFLPPRMTEDERNNISSPAQGLVIYCSNCGTNGEAQLYNGTEWTNMTGAAAAGFVCGTSNVTYTYNGETVTYGTVLREYGGDTGSKCWLDRNLGASKVATSSTDTDAHGDYFQWGRGNDGHQIMTSDETTSTSSSSSPGAKFITDSNDWYTGTVPNPNNLWKEDGSGVNNPCPSGYRVPTEAEWEYERLSWDSDNAAGAINSPLKLPMAGYRDLYDGSLFDVGTLGYYWSSTVNSASSKNLFFFESDASMYSNYRAYGFSVRCIKD